MSHPDAESFCNLVDGNLVSVNSQGEQDFLISQQSTVDIQYWIGLTDRVSKHDNCRIQGESKKGQYLMKGEIKSKHDTFIYFQSNQSKGLF